MSKQIEPYKCAFSLNHKILSSVANLTFNLGRLSALTLKTKGKEDDAKAVFYSLSSEGIELTKSQVKGLGLGESLPNIPYADSLMKLYSSLGKIDPYGPTIKDKFEELSFPNGVPFRMGRKSEGFPFPLPMPSKINDLIKGLFDYGEKAKGNIHPLVLAALYYFEIISIAPFSQGNSLLGRLYFKAILGSYSKSLLLAPVEKIIYKNKDKINEAIKESIEKGDISPFTILLLDTVSESLDVLFKETKGTDLTPNPLVIKMVSKMEDGRYYGALELLSLLGLKSRLALQNNYLKPALKSGKIKMSNPLTPTDRNQRYIKA